MLKEPKDIQQNKTLLEALIRLKAMDEGKVILKWLNEEKNRLQDLNDKEDETHKLRQRQGASQVIRKFLEITEGSRESRNKLMERKKNEKKELVSR